MRDRTHTRVTRREFTGVLCAATALPALGAAQTGVPAQPDYVPPPRPLVADEPPFAEPFEFTRTVVAAKVEPFPLTNVRLLPNNVFHDAQEWNRGYMARLAADRLLYTFRVNAGLPVGSARPLGGWEQPENGRRSSELRGHFAGHFLSASALLYASTGDTEAKSKADYMVGELVLAGDLGADGLTDGHIVGPNLRVGAADVEQHGSPLAQTNRTPPISDIEIPTFRAPGTDPSTWIRPAGTPQEFRTTGQRPDVRLLPLNKLFDRRYAVYWQMT